MSLNIVELIENNPITKLTNTYQGKLLTKIQEKFTDSEQQMFVSSLYCYLNYNQKNDFIIDLDHVWKWMGFSQKVNAKTLLEKNFIIEEDYTKSLLLQQKQSEHKKSLYQQGKQSDHVKGGHNKETIMLTIRTFKLFCLKAGTKKAEQIHEYYIKLEETLQEIIQEESNELKLQLEQKTQQLEKHIILSEEEKLIVREKTLLEQFPPNTQCFYYGFIDNLSDKNERLIKFGNSNFLKNRVYTHKKTYLNFRLVNVFKVDNKIQIENAMKEHPLFKERQRTITIKFNSHSKKFIELLNINTLALDELDKTIKAIITNLEYSPENYIKILEENRSLKHALEKANHVNNSDNLFILQTENARLKLENLKLIKRYKALSIKTNENVHESEIIVEQDIHPITQLDVNNYGNVIPSLKKIMKNKQGLYDVDGKQFELLEGTRQQVWDEKAYKTSGGLLKHNLIINKHGNIVSKRKSILENNNKRLFVCGVNKTPDE
jgi:hypothetical protein